MLNVIMRLGLPGNSTLENRILAVDIASTLFYWDQRAAQDATQVTRPSMIETDPTLLPADNNCKQSGDGEQHNRCTTETLGTMFGCSSCFAVQTYNWLFSCCRLDVSRLTPSMNEMIANFLLRMAFVR